MLQAVIFDFDGLMVDTEWPAYEAWSHIFGRYKQTLPLEKWVAAVGTFHGFDPVAYLSELTGEKLDQKTLFEEKESLKAEACSMAPAMPGVTERIAEARSLGLKVAVVSTSDREWVESHLRRLGLWGKFDDVITREDVKKVKPDPEPYLKAADRLKVEPKNCVVFEDSLNGVRAAKSAGMICVAVPNRVTHQIDFGIADRRVASLLDVRLSEF